MDISSVLNSIAIILICIASHLWRRHHNKNMLRIAEDVHWIYTYLLKEARAEKRQFDRSPKNQRGN